MQLGAIVFIIPWKALYMFRVLFASIIRIGMVPDPVCYKMIRSWESTLQTSDHHVTDRI
jgi:hypothetical protein